MKKHYESSRLFLLGKPRLKKIVLSISLTLLAFTSSAQFPAPYCIANFASGVEPITLVQFAGIDNASSDAIGGDALQDFTAITGNVVAGSSYSIKVKGNTDGSFTSEIVVYFDWNQNGDLTDAGEKYVLPSITNSTGTDAVESVFTIQVSSSALAGSTRMRVLKRFNTVPDPCNTAGYGQGEDYAVDVTIPTCPSVSGLTSTTTVSSADLSWTENGTATEWDIEYGMVGFTPTGTPTQAGLTTNQALLTSLNPSSVYDFYVRAVCSTTDASTWTGPYSFATLCGPISALPWTENFDNMTTVDYDLFPLCWVAETTYEWGTDNYPTSPPYDAGPLSGSNYLFVSYYSDSKVWTPEFELVAGETYEFSFNWAGDGGSGWAGAVYVNGSQTTSGSTMLGTKFVEFGDVTTINYQKEVYCFTPTTSGVYTFGVHVEEVDYEYYLNFDDFELKQVVTTPGVDGSLSTCQIGSPVDLNTVITTTVTDGTWTFDINPNAVNVNMFNTNSLATGTYEILYLVGGCIPDTTVATITVVKPSSAGSDGSIAVCRNQPFNLLSGLVGNADFGGVWTDPNAVVVPNGNATSGNLPGQYNYKYIVSNGVCPADTAKVVVNIQGCDFLGLEDVAFEAFSLYPNPTSNVIYITNLGSTEVFNYEVLDMNGRVILKADDAINGTATTEINLNQVEVGVYLVRVFNENTNKTFRVVKN